VGYFCCMSCASAVLNLWARMLAACWGSSTMIGRLITMTCNARDSSRQAHFSLHRWLCHAVLMAVLTISATRCLQETAYKA
jgi:hypothetical protein